MPVILHEMKTLPLLTSIVLVMAAVSLVSCVSGKGDNTLKEVISSQLKAFPESSAQDIYKSFCQDNLGPEHMIPDPEYAANYLHSELATYKSDLEKGLYRIPEERYYTVGDKGNYIRVDLSVVLDSLVSEENLLNAFVESANAGKNMTEDQWKEKWKEIETILRKDFPGIDSLEEDLSQIDSLVSQGNLILHHSRMFNAAYHPHYRIIRKEVFDKRILPFLPQ